MNKSIRIQGAAHLQDSMSFIRFCKEGFGNILLPDLEKRILYEQNQKTFYRGQMQHWVGINALADTKQKALSDIIVELQKVQMKAVEENRELHTTVNNLKRKFEEEDEKAGCSI